MVRGLVDLIATAGPVTDVPGGLDQGGGPAPISVPARQEQRHRRRHPRPAAAAGTGQPAAVGAARGRGRRAGPAGPGVRPAEPAGGAAPAADQGPGVRQLMPVTPLTGELTKTDLVVLVEHWADPRALLAAGRSRLLARITKTSHGQQGAARTDAWRAAAQAAVDLYGEHPAVAYSDLAAEVLTEVRLLTAVRAELVGHAEARADAYRWTAPARLAASLPCLAEVGAPTVTAIAGRAARFPTGKQFRSLTGLAPRASETGETDRKGQPMSKAGNRLLRTTLV